MVKQYFAIANMFLITFAGYLSVSGFYSITTATFDSMNQGRVSTEPPPARVVVKPIPASLVKTITERNFLNTSKDAVSQKKSIDTGKLQETDLKLKLWGTVTGDEKNAYAVIEDTKDRRQNLYKEGDSIQHATVKLIQREVVILTINGKDEKLSIEEGGSVKGRSRQRGRSPLPRSSTGGQNINVKRSQIDESLQDINKLMKEVKIRPHFKDGKPDGLILSSIKPRSLFRKMGLRNGDIITGIDGKKIESVDDALGFYESLRSSSNISLQIKRRGRDKTIDYAIE